MQLTYGALSVCLSVSVSVCLQVSGNSYVCGAYTPVSWPADAAERSRYVADPYGRTFLFSLTNKHGRAVKLRLKDSHCDEALNLSGSHCGPAFGCDEDLQLMHAEAADEPQGCSTQPSSFEIDHEAERQAGLPPIPFAYDKKLLAGRDGKARGYVYFAAAEIEVYKL